MKRGMQAFALTICLASKQKVFKHLHREMHTAIADG